jgi:hypothetical protein
MGRDPLYCCNPFQIRDDAGGANHWWAKERSQPEETVIVHIAQSASGLSVLVLQPGGALLAIAASIPSLTLASNSSKLFSGSGDFVFVFEDFLLIGRSHHSDEGQLFVSR